MSLYFCKSEVHDGGHAYYSSFILVARNDQTLPDNIDQILTAWEFGLTVKDVEEQGDEVWSGYRVVSCHVEKEIPDDEWDVIKQYITGVNLYYVLDDVEYGDERDQEVTNEKD